MYYYAGAAAAAGQSYAGAIIASKNGEWPANPEAYMDRLTAALDRCGIKKWELFEVKHEGSEEAPLDLEEGVTLEACRAAMI